MKSSCFSQLQVKSMHIVLIVSNLLIVQSIHHVTFILYYTVLWIFLALVFALIRVRKHWKWIVFG